MGVALMAAFLIGFLLAALRKGNRGTVPGPDATMEREVVTVYDTAYIDMPIPRDSVAVRYVTARLPAATNGGTAEAPGHGTAMKEEGSSADTVEVEIPITQKEYGDSTYRAWVSGYMASLDSIRIYSRTVTVTERLTLDKTRKWGFTVGPTVGAGWNGRSFSPYVGIGVSWGWRF